MQVAHIRLEAAQRALALFQALGNLHCFDAARCAPAMHLAFARMLAAQLRPGAAAAAAAAGGGSCVCFLWALRCWWAVSASLFALQRCYGASAQLWEGGGSMHSLGQHSACQLPFYGYNVELSAGPGGVPFCSGSSHCMSSLGSPKCMSSRTAPTPSSHSPP